MSVFQLKQKQPTTARVALAEHKAFLTDLREQQVSLSQRQATIRTALKEAEAIAAKPAALKKQLAAAEVDAAADAELSGKPVDKTRTAALRKQLEDAERAAEPAASRSDIEREKLKRLDAQSRSVGDNINALRTQTEKMQHDALKEDLATAAPEFNAARAAYIRALARVFGISKAMGGSGTFELILPFPNHPAYKDASRKDIAEAVAAEYKKAKESV